MSGSQATMIAKDESRKMEVIRKAGRKKSKRKVLSEKVFVPPIPSSLARQSRCLSTLDLASMRIEEAIAVVSLSPPLSQMSSMRTNW